MKRLSTLALCALLSVAARVEAPAQALVYWTGILPTGWQGGITPVDGDNIYLGNAVNEDVTLTGSISLNAVVLAPGGDKYTIDSPSAVTLDLAGGLVAGDTGFGRLVIQPNVTLSVAGSQAFDAGNNTIVVYSKLTGTGAPVFLATGGGGAFLFVNVGGPNDYTGNTTVGDGTYAPTFSFWSGSPFGSTGSVNFLNGGTLIAHNSETITNSLTLDTVGSSNALIIRSWDAPLTFTGPVTLANNTTITAQTTSTAYGFANGAGSLPVPGQMSRNPIIFSGAIGQTGGARALTVQGPGIAVLSGANTYTGGTTVSGSLIFATNAAIPASGTVTINANGYAGLGDLSAGNFAAQIAAHFNLTSTGAIGVDTLPGNPTTVTLSDSINLSNQGGNGTTPLNFTAGNVRLGTATSAILAGSLTPQGNNYLFGNGGGTLFVQTALGDTAGNGVSFTGRQLQLNNTGPVPLKLWLQGVNTYTGGTSSNTGFVIFDGAAAVPATGSLLANGSSTNVGGSYLGFTDNVLGATPTGAAVTTQLNLFNKTGTWGIVGFDSFNVGSPITINNLDLTGFNNGVFVGTATSAILTGTITPTTVTNANNAANTLRLTAGNGGTLTVNSALADGGSALALMLGSPGTANPYFSNGTISLNGANTYTGGTTLNASAQGLTVGLGSSSALGNGTLTVLGAANGLAALQATTGGVNLANNITLSNTPALYLQGTNSLTLSGAISGLGTIQLQRPTTAAAGAATLAGNNAAFDGNINVQNSTLTLAQNNAAGQANLNFLDSSSSVVFAGAATLPKIYGISGDSGSLVLPNGTGTVLTFQMDDDTTHSGDFGGVISGAGGTVTDAAVVVNSSNNSSNDTLYLHGHNLYSGGTTISGYGVLGLGYSDSAGSGPVTVSATNGGLILNTGVTFTNPLVFNSGGLAGLGTFAPSSVTGTGQTAGKITFGAGQLVFPGIPGGGTQTPGQLTIQTNVAFAAGGSFREMIQDPTASGGYGVLAIQGDLDLSLVAASSFVIALESIDITNRPGYSTAIAWGQTYSIPIIQTTGSILGFNAAGFTFDTSSFQNGLADAGSYSLSVASGKTLVLTFTAVPEPSTWALLATGAGLLGLTALRRRLSGGR